MTPLTEQETRSRFITPAIKNAGWDLTTQVREDYRLTNGRIMARKRLHYRDREMSADYVLFFKPNLPLVIVEAKRYDKSIGDGMQQALGYADCLDVPFVFSSNGKGFLFHDRTVEGTPTETEIALNEFPSPEVLWQKYCSWKGFTSSDVAKITEPYKRLLTK